MESRTFRPESLESIDPGKSQLINFDKIIKNEKLEDVAEKLIESTFAEQHFMRKDAIDRLIDFTFFKVQTGSFHVLHMAYPTKRMHDLELESKIIRLFNELLYPEIVLRILKFFTRNIHDSDSNLYIANLVESEAIIRSVYETFRLFQKDIFIYEPEKKSLNVKRIQQFSPQSDYNLSLPLDACARLKYILEFFQIRQDVRHIYKPDDIRMFGIAS
ncbi:MAG TPA: hypothetical protein P5120_06610 [Spirochaetota bacterium]|nr:hypothetical protein [Spirochaetota bacterium]HPF05969.1 hypothetical protein [Spirochaetota bacterium]HPJ42593.1 hypothetical protein [Spirochaetota bacterium]HPR37373.1 hypothetical protein [Spirochaetota bacterium]HRX47172.1 hypothetical protein [Spirochaetota bacterium]